jgi:hypothetical protein
VSIDPIIDARHRARCGYQCDIKAATRDREDARSRYAYTGHGARAAAFLEDR